MWQEEVSIKFSGYCCQTETGFHALGYDSKDSRLHYYNWNNGKVNEKYIDNEVFWTVDSAHGYPEKEPLFLLEGHENDTYLYNPITDKSKTLFPRGFLSDNMFHYRGKLYSLWVDLGRLRIWNVHNPHENYHIGFINLIDKMPRAVVANDKIFIFLDIRCIRCFNVEIDGFEVELVPYSGNTMSIFSDTKNIYKSILEYPNVHIYRFIQEDYLIAHDKWEPISKVSLIKEATYTSQIFCSVFKNRLTISTSDHMYQFRHRFNSIKTNKEVESIKEFLKCMNRLDILPQEMVRYIVDFM